MTEGRSLYRWTRDIHLYVGLFLSPFVLLYAVSAILLNHAYLPWGGMAAAPVETRTVRVSVQDAENSLDVARQVQRQLGVRGEIGFVSRRRGGPRGGPRLSFPIETPGRTTSVRVDLATGVATLERKDTGAWDALIYLHKMPGPHNATIRGNWLFTRLWGWLADGTVYLLLFLSASGVYLWTVLKADRRSGLISLGVGMLSFMGLVLAVIA
ncbi:MAG: PepSY-associated TM helix domain-containing protein [Gemmatimonadaceae bacterium]